MTAIVTLEPAGRRFEVQPDETILAAALRHGITLPYGCRDGACGACKCQLLAGAVSHGHHARAALTEREEAQGRILACCARPQGDVVLQGRELVGLGDVPIRRMPCRVARIERPAHDVAVVRLQLPAGDPLQYRAGQYLDFILRDGTRRSYSIATAPGADATLELHVRHMPGGRFTDMLFGVAEPAVKERDILRCEAPLGTFFLREEDPHPIVLLAGGTGFAPIKAIAEHVFRRGLNRDAPGRAARRIALYWGCRARRDLYLDALPAQWAATEPNFSYVPVLSEASPQDAWSGATGLVHEAVMRDFPDLSGHQVYACGAPAMIDAAQRDFAARCGLPQEQFFADSFVSQADLA
ncbi:MAG TPA: CDP-6-deoxy-delta-3,4-glucoseen reductase [Burkholderiaceae bacterium]|nr:CDP-6-deoxy-delta-3,4-glucoseen reductase [Burkholderiaceae bacterium]